MTPYSLPNFLISINCIKYIKHVLLSRISFLHWLDPPAIVQRRTASQPSVWGMAGRGILWLIVVWSEMKLYAIQWAVLFSIYLFIFILLVVPVSNARSSIGRNRDNNVLRLVLTSQSPYQIKSPWHLYIHTIRSIAVWNLLGIISRVKSRRRCIILWYSASQCNTQKVYAICKKWILIPYQYSYVQYTATWREYNTTLVNNIRSSWIPRFPTI